MNNIKQLTNFSEVLRTADRTNIEVEIGNKTTETKEYYILPISILTDNNAPITKLGYVCEPKGIYYPIMITTGNESRTFYLGKNGIFEVMTETFLDINESGEDGEGIELIPQITEIRLPVGFQFKLDYVFTIDV